MRNTIVVLLAAALISGCSSEDTPSTAPLGSQADPILYGSLDTTHQAVVAYLVGGSKCSATIIHRVGGQGYALTAAHCIGSVNGVLRQGDNHTNGQYDVQYTVVERDTHPEYGQSQLYDFGMLRFTGATAATPTIAAISPAEDNLSQGNTVDLVGYGLTEVGGTTLRHHLVRPITYLTDLRLIFDQSGQNGGLCSGDSGGPALKISPERVAGVSSTVAPDCYGWGTSVRVSAVYDTFIMPFINNTPYQEQTCDQCSEAMNFDGVCSDEVQDCLDDADCDAYLDCLQNCNNSTCALWCVIDYPSGAALYEDIEDCLCNVGCASECQNDGMCAAGPPCGFSSGLVACQSCFEGQCCAQASACADDPICASCYTLDPHPSCPTAEAQAFTTCLETNCALECDMGTGGEGGGGEGGSGGVGGGTGAVGPGGSATGGQAVGGGAPGGAGGAGGEPPPESFTITDDGCGCRLGQRSTPAPGLRLLALLGLALGMTRRRRR